MYYALLNTVVSRVETVKKESGLGLGLTIDFRISRGPPRSAQVEMGRESDH